MRQALLQRLPGAASLRHLPVVLRASTRHVATAPTTAPPPTPASHPAFTLQRTVPLPEQAAHAHVYRHTATGAEVLSVVCPSEREKVFGAAFLTVPGDDSGVAHVLEHSVLCGSARYPSKEPFVTLLASSLQTYLNAMTYPDRTVYPVASPNTADFYNLVRVYLDAVLCPRLGQWVLAQEGWHLEVAAAGGAASSGSGSSSSSSTQPRTLKASGVVYNEMKGVYSNADSVHAMACDAALFPDTPYSRSSGGDPLAITALTPERFAAFHAQNYSPARAKLWFFGDDPEAKRLEILEEFLGPMAAGQGAASAAAPEAAALLHPTTMPLQQPFAAPRWVSLPYPAAQESSEGGGVDGELPEEAAHEAPAGATPAAPSAPTAASAAAPSAMPGQQVARPTDPLSWDALACTRAGYGGSSSAPLPAAPTPTPAAHLPNHFLTVNWCLGEVGGEELTPTTRLGLGILSHLLMGTQTSTLRKALTDSGLGSSVTGGGYDDSGKQATFAAGLKGVAGGDVARVEALVLHALTMAAGGGFDASHIAASVNTVEFGLREFSTGGGPKGLSLFLGSAGAWVHGRDPIAELCYKEALEGVKREVELAGGEGCSTGYFARLVSGYLLGNAHRVAVHSWPDAAWGERREAAEQAWLKGHGEGLSEAGWEGIAATAAELQRRQAAPDREEDVAKIPRLTLRDVDVRVPELPYATVAGTGSSSSSSSSSSSRGPSSVLVSSQQDTAGIGYLRCHIPLPHLPPHLLPLLPLLAWSFTSMGTTQGKDEAALSRAIGTHTGGLGASSGLWDTCPNGSHESLTAIPHITLAGKALGGKGGQLGALLQEVALHSNLDRKERCVTYLKEKISRAEAGLVSSGHSAASAVLGATSGGGGGQLALMRDTLGGLTALRVARTLLHRIETGEGGGWAQVLQDLHSLREYMLAQCSSSSSAEHGYPLIISSVVGDAAVLAEFQGAAGGLMQALAEQGGALRPRAPPASSQLQLPFYLPSTPFPSSLDELAAFSSVPGAAMGLTAADLRGLSLPAGAGGRLEADFALAVPATVNFVVKAGRLSSGCAARRVLPLPTPLHTYALPSPLRQAQAMPSSLEPPAALLRTGYLWERVRVSGGAYGAGCSLNFTTGGMSFHSYRDPNLAATLAAFDGVGSALEGAAAADGGAAAEPVLQGPILSTIGSLDAPLAPVERGDKACARWLHGGSPEMAQDWRDGVLGAGKEDMLMLAAAAEEVRVAGRVAVVGGEQALGGWQRAAGSRQLITLKPLVKK